MIASSSRSSKVAKQALRRTTKAADGAAASRRSAASKNIGSLQSRSISSSASRIPRGSLSALKLQKDILRHPARYYTTEQVLKLRGSKIDTEKQKVLYDAKDEKDNCGVGLIANMKSIPSRHVVEVADEMLVRMAHRGGCGCDPASGDGAGFLLGMPDSFMRTKAKELFATELPPMGEYAVGNVFFPPGSDTKTVMDDCKAIMERLVKERGLSTVGWRRVPVDNSMLGKDPLDSEPITEQIFVTVAGSTAKDRKTFEQDLLLVRKMAEEEATDMLGPESGFYVNSLTTNHITYKGQLTPEQVSQYYKDLADPTFETHLALVHSRFSTNTFPSWERAQPIRMMCHNGEINTLRGNKNWMYSRGGIMESPIYGNDTPFLLPAVSDHMSDSGNFDSVLELLTKASNRSLPESVMMMIPEAWQGNDSLSDAKKAFYEYNSCVMEPWDGPAMVAFTDERYIGATLDRNGLRPSRYYVTNDDHVILSSEIGVSSELPDVDVKIKHRLEPGKMFLVDFETQRIVPDNEIKEQIAAAKPYSDWVDGNIDLASWAKSSGCQADPMDFNLTNRKLNMFGYTSEKLDVLLLPMAINGKEALGSMGNDAALAVLSEQPRQVNDYFKQLFAQVTNPPIDPIREEIVMSLVCPVGPEGNLLADDGPEHSRRLVVNHPVLTLEEMATLKGNEFKRSDGSTQFKCTTIDTTFPVGSGADGMLAALERICDEAADAIQGGKFGEKGAQGVILSDKFAGPDRMALPSLLAVGAVHHHLIGTKQRPKAAIFAEVGDAKEVHDYATIFGYGCDGVCPYMAYESLSKMNADGMVEARAKKEMSDDELFKNYRNAAAKGLLKVMSKMGISTLQSYKGAQVFEAVGLADEVVDRCFTGTTTRIQGTDFEALYRDLERFHDDAFPIHDNEDSVMIRSDGQFHYRAGGEAHLNTPDSMVNLQIAARTNSRDAYKEFSRITNEQNSKVTLRGQLKFKYDPSKAIPLEEVEPVSEIVKRFATGAMSLGSISQEAHETLAVAMNTLGGRSNTGEGGEDPKRFTDNRRSSIKQVASGRFGVTSNYLANSDQIQIKMAQGAKPGEGGELPGFKVSEYIAENRHTTPGVGLISPPPHHDIYSIEDLAQLIHDLKNAQPTGEVSTKLVSEVGVGVIAAGVAKALSDHITISGHDGGTGAAAWTGVKGCGLPWELGLAETQQTLVLNGLRDRIKLQTDGQLKTGRDVAIACLLGAEEFGFATAPLITMGCIMMRKCHLNTCPVGVATQDEELRKKFTGQPEHVVNYFFLLAEEVREIMAKLGYRKMEDMIGQTQHLELNKKGQHYKSRGLDLTPLLTPASELNPSAGVRNLITQYHGIDVTLDNKFIAQAQDALNNKAPVVINERIENTDRTLGTMLSYEISKRYGGEGLPDDTITLNLEGKGGQSFGFTLAKGITANVIGDANDYTGKGLSGGKIAVFPSKEAVATGFKPEDHVVVGNVCLYGATSGKAFFNGKAGERFCVRNSGALAVVEGVGDHGCEYMTGGVMVCLGETGRNFAAGMSGGIAYVYDPEKKFPARCNMGLVGLEKIDTDAEKEEVFGYIQEHVAATASSVGAEMLENWDSRAKDFVKVFPHDYKRVLEERAAASAEAA